MDIEETAREGVELVRRHAVERSAMEHRGVVDEDVDAATIAEHRVTETPRGGGIGERGLQISLHAQILEFLLVSEEPGQGGPGRGVGVLGLDGAGTHGKEQAHHSCHPRVTGGAAAGRAGRCRLGGR